MKYRLTIITPTLNAGSTILSTLHSIKSLSILCKDLQHILIDGGSTDMTLNYIEDYVINAEYDVLLLHQKTHGVYAAMNQAIDHALGEYIHILNADDVLLDPYLYNSVLEYCSANSPKVVSSGVIYRNETDQRISRIWPSFRPTDPIEKALMNGFQLPHPGLIVHYSIYTSRRYNIEYPYSSDLDFIRHILNAIPPDQIYYVPVFLVSMNPSGLSSTTRARLKLFIEMLSSVSISQAINYIVRRYYIRVLSILYCTTIP